MISPDHDASPPGGHSGHCDHPLGCGRLRWARPARVLYRGDLDSDGLQILGRARRAGIPVESVLMDGRDLAVAELQAAAGFSFGVLIPGEVDALSEPMEP